MREKSVLFLVGKPYNPAHGGGIIAFWETVRAYYGQDPHIVVAFPAGLKRNDDVPLPVPVHEYASTDDLTAFIDAQGIRVLYTLQPHLPVMEHCKKAGIYTFLELRHPSLAPVNHYQYLLGRLNLMPTAAIGEVRMLQRVKRGARLADRVVVISAYLKGQAIRQFGLPADKIAVAPNGVSTGQPGGTRRPLPERAPRRIVCINRMERDKRVDAVINTFARLKGEFPDVVLDIIGGGSLEGKLKRMVERAGIRDVVFHGPLGRARTLHLLGEGYMLLHASQRESFCNVVAEAMSSGLPCVAFNVGAIPELIPSAAVGLLADSPEAFYRQARFLLANPQSAARMGESARTEITARYRWDKRAAQVRALIDQCRHEHPTHFSTVRL